MSLDTKSRYPADRPPYFAQKVIRKMVKTCAASEMGQTAFMLVAIVATTEDAAGYTRPVTFFNDALLPLIGVRKWDTLDRARKIAVDAGWLEYQAPASGKRTPGRYWVKIPSHLEALNDSPVDEEVTKAYPINGDASGKAYPVNGDDTRKAYTQNGYASEKAYPMNGEGMGDAMGEPSSYTYTKKEESHFSSEEEEPANGKAKFQFLDRNGNEWVLQLAKLEKYRETFPHLDVDQCLREASLWCEDAAPSERPTAKGVPRFLSSWLRRQKAPSQTPPSHHQESLDHSTEGIMKAAGGITAWLE